MLLDGHKIGRPYRPHYQDGDDLLDGHEGFLNGMSYFSYVSWMVIDRDGHKIGK